MSVMPATDRRTQGIQAISSLWWLVLMRGIVIVLVGIYALVNPGMTLIAFTQVLGAFVLIDGAIALIEGILGRTESRIWTLTRGVLGIVVGLFVFAHPVIVGVIAATTIVLVVGLQTIAAGVLEIFVGIRARKEVEGEGWLILGGVLAVVFGGILMIAPFASSLVLIRILGAFAILYGITLIMTSFRMRKLGTVGAGS
jgi:uncharacterized membrane protein HdeD (DUF308 family)